jgi:hypothetical protein
MSVIGDGEESVGDVANVTRVCVNVWSVQVDLDSFFTMIILDSVRENRFNGRRLHVYFAA